MALHPVESKINHPIQMPVEPDIFCLLPTNMNRILESPKLKLGTFAVLAQWGTEHSSIYLRCPIHADSSGRLYRRASSR